jgi:hypothetical protein
LTGDEEVLAKGGEEDVCEGVLRCPCDWFGEEMIRKIREDEEE